MTVYRPSQSHVTTVTRSRSHQRHKQIEKENSENISHQRICFKDELRVVKSAKMGKLIPQEFVNPSTNHQDKMLKKNTKNLKQGGLRGCRSKPISSSGSSKYPLSYRGTLYTIFSNGSGFFLLVLQTYPPFKKNSKIYFGKTYKY